MSLGWGSRLIMGTRFSAPMGFMLAIFVSCACKVRVIYHPGAIVPMLDVSVFDLLLGRFHHTVGAGVGSVVVHG